MQLLRKNCKVDPVVKWAKIIFANTPIVHQKVFNCGALVWIINIGPECVKSSSNRSKTINHGVCKLPMPHKFVGKRGERETHDHCELKNNKRTEASLTTTLEESPTT